VTTDYERAMRDVLDTIKNPGTTPLGAPGSLMREAQDLGKAVRRLVLASQGMHACHAHGLSLETQSACLRTLELALKAFE